MYVIQGDSWLCTELLDVSVDKFCRVLHSHDRRIPENVLRKIAVDVRYNYVFVTKMHSIMHVELQIGAVKFTAPQITEKGDLAELANYSAETPVLLGRLK